MTQKALTIDSTFGSTKAVPVESGQQQQWVDVLEAADLDAFVESVSYAPLITSSGAGVIEQIGLFSAFRIGTEVIVIGSLAFTPAVTVTPENLTIALPAGATMAPAANFGAVTDVTGSASLGGVHAATNGTDGPAAKVAAKTATLLAVTVTGKTTIGVVLRYRVK